MIVYVINEIADKILDDVEEINVIEYKNNDVGNVINIMLIIMW
jgi:hypothetical protein